MSIKLKKGWLILFLFISQLALADTPVQMLQNMANRMIQQLDAHKRQLHGSRVINHIVNEVIVPKIDANRMAGSVVGRNYWTSASLAQRQTFVNQFKTLVINTYAAALASYDQDRVKVEPSRGNIGQSFMRVNSVILRRNGQRIPISYNLIKIGSQWKIYDFSIENVSIIQNYRSQFASTLIKGGMPLLIAKLKSHNRSES